MHAYTHEDRSCPPFSYRVASVGAPYRRARSAVHSLNHDAAVGSKRTAAASQRHAQHGSGADLAAHQRLHLGAIRSSVAACFETACSEICAVGGVAVACPWIHRAKEGGSACGIRISLSLRGRLLQRLLSLRRGLAAVVCPSMRLRRGSLGTPDRPRDLPRRGTRPRARS